MGVSFSIECKCPAVDLGVALPGWKLEVLLLLGYFKSNGDETDCTCIIGKNKNYCISCS